MPIHNHNNSNLFFPLKFIEYAMKKPLHALSYMLLITRIMRVFSFNEHSKDLNNNDLIEQARIHEEVTHKIANNDYADAQLRLISALNWHPNNQFLLEENLRLSVYQALYETRSLKTIGEFKGSAQELLKLDSNNEFALAVQQLKHVYQNENKNLLPLHTKLRYPLAYFARGFVNLKRADQRDNVALAYSAILDLSEAIKLEQNAIISNDLFRKLLNEANRVYTETINHPRYNRVNFFNLDSTYLIQVDIESANFFNTNEGNRFSINEITETVAEHLALILGLEAKLPDPFSDIKAKPNSHRPLVLIPKGDHYYLYQATLRSEYELILQKGHQGQKIEYDKRKITNEFLTQNVIGIINPYGYICADTSSLNSYFASVKQNKMNSVITENPIDETYFTLPTFGELLSIIVHILLGGFVINYFKNLNEKKKKIEIQKQMEQQLVEVINATHKSLADVPLWTLQPNNEKSILLGNTDLVKPKIAITTTKYKCLAKHPTISIITLDNASMTKLWIRKLKIIFGNNNIKQISKGKISLTVDYAWLLKEREHLGSKIKTAADELLADVIQQSPEYKISCLQLKLKTAKEEFKNNQNQLLDFWLKNKSRVVAIKKDAENSLNSEGAVKRKAGEVFGLCQSLLFSIGMKLKEENNLKEDTENDKRTGLTLEIFLLEVSLTSYEQKLITVFKEQEFKKWVENIENELSKLNQLSIAIGNLKPLWLDIDFKLSELEIKYKSLKMTIEKKDKKVSSDKWVKPFSENKIKEPSKEKNESENEKVARLAKAKEKQNALNEDRLRRELEKEGKIRRKKEADEKVKKSLEKNEEIEKLKHDPLLNMLEHQTAMLEQALSLYQNPVNHDLINFCSGNKKLHEELLTRRYKDLAYCILIMGTTKGAHSLGQMMLSYQQYYILGAKPYITRNLLMHKFYFIYLETLVAASSEFNSKFTQLISGLQVKGFPTQIQTIVLTSELFNDDFIKKINERKITKTKLYQKLWDYFDLLNFMYEMINHIISKNEEIYSKHCGLLHQAITSCVSLIGVLLNKLFKMDYALYEEIMQHINKFENLFVTYKNAIESIYQNIRVKVGHFFSSKDTHEKKTKFYELGENIYKEVSPELLRYICRDSSILFTKINPLLQKAISDESKLNPYSKPFNPEESSKTLYYGC